MCAFSSRSCFVCFLLFGYCYLLPCAQLHCSAGYNSVTLAYALDYLHFGIGSQSFGYLHGLCRAAFVGILCLYPSLILWLYLERQARWDIRVP